MDDEKRMIQNYEVKNAIHIGGKEVILAEDLTSNEPYMVCNCQWDNPLSMEVYSTAVAGDDYLEAMGVFMERVNAEVQRIQSERKERGVAGTPLTTGDCIPRSALGHYEGQLVVIRPESMVASARTADMQLLLATGGNGCSPDARGQAVFCKNLFTGKQARWNRTDVAGIIQPERIPSWALPKLEAMGVPVPAGAIVDESPNVVKQPTLVPGPEYPPLYMESLAHATAKGETKSFHDSWRLNEHCAVGIEKAINDSYQGDYRYDLPAALHAMTADYGKERVHFVLANTLQILDHDGRFSDQNKAWAQSVPMPDLTHSERASFFCKAHSAILDGLINVLRKEQQKLEKKPSVQDKLKRESISSPKKDKKPTRDEAR